MNERVKHILSRLVPASVWNYLRDRKIVRRHRQVADVCDALVEEYYASSFSKSPLPVRPLKDLGTQKVIWQYWAQGFEDVPPVVRQCVDSVDKWAGEYRVIRLDDANLSDYLELPDYVEASRQYMSRAYFSDLLRLCILSVYGGLWLDATIFMSGPIPSYLEEGEFFLYQRDAGDANKKYWKNVYAYYFSWTDGFRVNMLSSILRASKGGELVSALCGIMLYHWHKGSKSIPDYFFLQILFDVLIKGRMAGRNCRIVSDCKPHYLQQLINDPGFNLASRDEILNSIPMHKLTYK